MGMDSSVSCRHAVTQAAVQRFREYGTEKVEEQESTDLVLRGVLSRAVESAVVQNQLQPFVDRTGCACFVARIDEPLWLEPPIFMLLYAQGFGLYQVRTILLGSTLEESIIKGKLIRADKERTALPQAIPPLEAPVDQQQLQSVTADEIESLQLKLRLAQEDIQELKLELDRSKTTIAQLQEELAREKAKIKRLLQVHQTVVESLVENQ